MRDAILWSADNRRFPKPCAIENDIVQLRLTTGEYLVRGANPEVDMHGVAGFHCAADGSVDVLQWGFVGPGEESCMLMIRSPKGTAVEGAEVRARLAYPEDPDIRAGWYQVTAESDAGGHTYLPGLLPGVYDVQIAHSAFATQEVTLDVPHQSSAIVALQDTVPVAWQFELPREAEPVSTFTAFVRREGSQSWRPHSLGAGSRSGDYVLRGLQPGVHEVVCQGGTYWGHSTLRVDHNGDYVRAHLRMREAPAIAGKVLADGGSPAAGVAVELRIGDVPSAHSRTVTDAQGKFRLSSLAASLGNETVVVRDASAKVIAQEAARDEMEIQIGAW